jgi:predicted nucleotidyltransferase
MVECFEDLGLYFKKFKNISVAYLFGSHATGKNNEMSDLDIAVLLKRDYENKRIKLNILQGLVELGYDNVDLVILNRMSILGRHEVVKHNNILYQSDAFEAGSYFSLVVRKYLDFKPLLKTQRENLKERILNG